MNTEKQYISSKLLFNAIEETLSKNKMATFTVTGMSMWPFLCHGRDQVIVKACKSKEIKKGDIVLIKTILDTYLLHRVTNITPEGFETTGDGNCFRDGIFSSKYVIAKVEFLVYKSRKIDCNSFFYRFIVNLWMFLFPIRKLLLKTLKIYSKFKHLFMFNKKRL